MLTRRDLAGTVVAALVVLVYVANVEGWWYLGSNRWAAVTMLAVGAVGCVTGARLQDAGERRVPTAMLGGLGIASLVLAVIAIATGAQWALLSFTIVLVVLWAGSTLRHATTPHYPVAAG
jgi:hypothetical protein